MQETTLLNAIGRYFWLFCLILSAYQFYAAGRRVNAEESLSEPLRTRRVRYLQVFIGASMLPWIAMGLGQLTGATSTVWEYFRPQDMNPFVLAFFGSVFALSLAMFYWVFFMDGARKAVDLKLMQTHGISGPSPLTQRQVKLFAAFGPVFLLGWIALCVLADAPIRR